MDNFEKFSEEIEIIKQRNARVELEKAWETSWTRKIFVMALTYFIVVIFFIAADLPDPFINSLVPTLAFFLSGLSLPLAKKIWLSSIQTRYKK